MRSRATIAIAAVSVKRLLRDRSSIFFVFIFPMLLILLVGAQFGGGETTLTLAVSADAAGSLGDDLVTALDDLDRVEVERHDEATAVVDAVARGQVAGGLLVPGGYDDAIRSSPRGVVLDFVQRSDGASPAMQSLVLQVLGDQNQRISLADLVIVVNDSVSYDEALQQADLAVGVLPDIGVARNEVGSDELADEFSGLGQFDLGAVQQLNLFVFLMALSSGAALIENRELGITRRVLAAPVSAGQAVRGEALGRYAVALLQGLYIIVGTLLLFGVDWGDPISAITILAVYAAASAGAGMLIGALARTQQQAGAFAVGLGISIAAVGGSMLPVELMPPGVRMVSRFTPHHWSYEAFADVVRRGDSVLGILPALGILALQAVVLLGIAAVLVRRRLTR